MAAPGRYLLHAHPESGNCYKVALLLALQGQRFDYRPVALFEGATHTEEFRKLNRFEEIPVLEHGATVLCQSGTILTYLAEQRGSYGGRTPEEKRAIQEWILWENHRLLNGPVLMRFIRRFAQQTDPAVLTFLKPRAERALGQLERAVEAAPFLVGGRATIADIACCGYLFWLDQSGLDPARWPAIQRWLGRIADLPGFKAPDEIWPRG
jgi:glutathione S-transferase